MRRLTVLEVLDLYTGERFNGDFRAQKWTSAAAIARDTGMSSPVVRGTLVRLKRQGAVEADGEGGWHITRKGHDDLAAAKDPVW